MVGLEIKRSGFGGMTPSGVVVTGGGAMTVGCEEAARRNLAMRVHVGMPAKVTGLIDEIMTPAYTTSIGLAHWAAQTKKTDGPAAGGFAKFSSRIQVKGIAGKVIELVKSFLP